MLKNYIKVAIRNIFKNRTLSIINIAGLAIGMAGAVLLLLNIQYVFSVDQFHEKKDRIYKAYNRGKSDGHVRVWSETAVPLAPALEKNYPEVKSTARFSHAWKQLAYGDKKLQVQGNYIDPAFLNMFSFPFVEGNAQSSLQDLNSIVITETLAKKIFGKEDPMNKIIRIENQDNVTVKGILKDLPPNTSFKFEYLLPWEQFVSGRNTNQKWDNQFLTTYAELKPGVDIEAFNKKIASIIPKEENESKIEIFLYSLTRDHLENRFQNGKPSGGRVDNMRMLGILAGIILLIACINFMNLSTARSEKRAREVGVRKVIGAQKTSLVFQFIGESILLSLFAGVVALILVQLLLPTFSSFAGIKPNIDFASPYFWLAATGFILLTGILAGSYPAFYLSSFKPVKVLKGVLKGGKALVTPRKVLVVVQFVLAIFLVNFTILFKKQIKHTEARAMGFVKENLVYHPLSQDLKKNYDLVKNELLSTGVAEALCKSNTLVSKGGVGIDGLQWEGKDPDLNIMFETMSAKGDFVKTNGLQLAEGRDIDMQKSPGDTVSCMLNETAVNMMNIKDPIGKIIREDNKSWTVVGVIKDFVIGSPNQSVRPLLVLGNNWAQFISIRLSNNGYAAVNARKAEAILKKYNPNYLTELQFADADFEASFKEARRASALINIFTFVAIFISCMGLFGLAAYMAENRTKEIGIRKVMGATVAGITALLTKDFVKLVLLSIIIATPLAWLFMNSFLRQFAYRTDITWWIFVIAGSGALLIAIITVSFQSIKLALSNPVKSLRTE